jgi:hypothetical protein
VFFYGTIKKIFTPPSSPLSTGKNTTPSIPRYKPIVFDMEIKELTLRRNYTMFGQN